MREKCVGPMHGVVIEATHFAMGGVSDGRCLAWDIAVRGEIRYC